MFDFKTFICMDRIVLCWRRDEDPGCLLKITHSFLPRLQWSILYEVLAWIHICMVMAMLKFAYVWHRSMLYIWYLCPSLNPLSHGSTLYSSSHGCLFLSWICLVLVCSHDEATSIHESKYWCIADAYSMTLSNQDRSYLEVITFSIKALSYDIPLASCFGGISVTLKFYHQHVIGSLR